MNSTRTRVKSDRCVIYTPTRLLMNNFSVRLSHYVVIGSLKWNDSSAEIFKYFTDIRASEFERWYSVPKCNAFLTRGVFLDYFSHSNRLYTPRLKLFPVSHKCCACLVRCNDIKMEKLISGSIQFFFSYLQPLLA